MLRVSEGSRNTKKPTKNMKTVRAIAMQFVTSYPRNL